MHKDLGPIFAIATLCFTTEQSALTDILQNQTLRSRLYGDYFAPTDSVPGVGLHCWVGIAAACQSQSCPLPLGTG